ncbi:hypothetical protein BV20DRAFT_1058329 [Pilatotrama ljubarskyi]|nr:hypothetical protein BV20DRAFT_1058329 [Pilatotrama ljubarskyi]
MATPPGPPEAQAALGSTAAGGMEFLVGFYPYALPGRHLRSAAQQCPVCPEMKWSGDDLGAVQQALKAANLTFSVTIPGPGLSESEDPPLAAWQFFDAQVVAHCNLFDIDMSHGHSSSLPPAPSTLPWQLLKPGAPRTYHGTRMTKYEAHGDLTPSTFTLATLCTAPFGTSIPNHIDNKPFLLIAPRFASLRAPLRNLRPRPRLAGQEREDFLLEAQHLGTMGSDSDSTTHPCFPARVLALADRFEGVRAVCTPLCVDHSPARRAQLLAEAEGDATESSSDDELPAFLAAFRERSSPHNRAQTLHATVEAPAAGTGPRATATESAVVLDIRASMASGTRSDPVRIRSRSSSLDGEMTSTAPSPRRRRVHPGAATARSRAPAADARPSGLYEPVSAHKILAWQDDVSEACTMPEHIPSAHISGPTAELTGAALVFLVMWQFNAKPPPDPEFANAIAASFPGVTCKLVPLSALLSRRRRFRVDEAIGVAPEIATLRAAVTSLTADTSVWADTGAYKSLSLHSSMDGGLEDREAMLKAAGFISFMHIVIMGVGPEPISPFLLQAVLEGRGGFLLHKKFIEDLDPDNFNVLKPWYDCVQGGGALPAQLQFGGALADLLNGADINTPALQGRSLPEHERHGVERTLTCRILLGDPDPTHHPDFIAFKTGFDFMRNAHSVRGLAEEFAGHAKGLLGTLYCRRVRDVPEFITERLRFERSPDASPSAVENEELFRRRLERYLTGIGHPSHPEVDGNVIPHELAEADRKNRNLRASLLLRMMSGSSLMPLETSWQLKFSFRHPICPDSQDSEATNRAVSRTDQISSML